MQTLEELIEQARHLPLKDRKQLIEVLEASLIKEEIGDTALTSQEEFRQRYPHITIDPDLFALVGIQAEDTVKKDRTLIREKIFRRSEALPQLLEKRLQQHEENPDDVEPWEKVRDELLKEL